MILSSPYYSYWFSSCSAEQKSWSIACDFFSETLAFTAADAHAICMEEVRNENIQFLLPLRNVFLFNILLSYLMGLAAVFRQHLTSFLTCLLLCLFLVTSTKPFQHFFFIVTYGQQILMLLTVADLFFYPLVTCPDGGTNVDYISHIANYAIKNGT